MRWHPIAWRGRATSGRPGRRRPPVLPPPAPPPASLPLLGTPVSAESTSCALPQLLRFLSMAALGFPIAFAIGPSDIGPAFARLHVPDRFAYAIDLTFRFIPSL